VFERGREKYKKREKITVCKINKIKEKKTYIRKDRNKIKPNKKNTL